MASSKRESVRCFRSQPSSLEGRVRLVIVAIALLTLWANSARAWRSTLYPTNWLPPTVSSISYDTNKVIQDFSYAGYKAGEAPIPSIAGPIFNVTSAPYNADKTGSNDATVAIQA